MFGILAGSSVTFRLLASRVTSMTVQRQVVPALTLDPGLLGQAALVCSYGSRLHSSILAHVLFRHGTMPLGLACAPTQSTFRLP